MSTFFPIMERLKHYPRDASIQGAGLVESEAEEWKPPTQFEALASVEKLWNHVEQQVETV